MCNFCGVCCVLYLILYIGIGMHLFDSLNCIALFALFLILNAVVGNLVCYIQDSSAHRG